MYLEFPKTPDIKICSEAHTEAIGVDRDELTLRRQTAIWQGQSVGFVLTMPVMRWAEACAWSVFLRRAATVPFLFTPPSALRHREPAGLASLAGRGAGPSARSEGWLPNIKALAAGDWVQIGRRLHMALQDAYSNADGDADLLLWPHLQGVASGTVVEYRHPRGVFVLADPNAPGMVRRAGDLTEEFSFTIEEALV